MTVKHSVEGGGIPHWLCCHGCNRSNCWSISQWSKQLESADTHVQSKSMAKALTHCGITVPPPFGVTAVCC